MTAQIPESLRYKGEDLSMCEEPLASYFFCAGSAPRFAPVSTALWRRYVGSWEIVDDRLYLVGIDAALQDGSKATLATIFPDAGDRVFADWFSGTVRVPQGRMIEYVHSGYSSTYERDMFLDIERGVVVAERVRQNGVAPPEKPKDHAVSATTTINRDLFEDLE